MRREHKVPESLPAESVLDASPDDSLSSYGVHCTSGRTALHRALGGGFIECAELLIENGADPNQADSLKRTSLHWAAMGPPPENRRCCELVFQKGDGDAMLKMTTKSGSTPLHSAAGTNRVDAVKFLVEKGVDQSIKDDDELTAYDLAKVCTLLLLSRSADMVPLMLFMLPAMPSFMCIPARACAYRRADIQMFLQS